MSKRYYKTLESLTSFTEGLSALPTHRPIAAYYRQSTEAQVGNISTAIQTIDMVAHLQTRGWKENDIHLIDMDAGISGMTKIDERPGMKLLFQLITDEQIGAVACQDEDRLFRDVTQIQVNIFIEACKTANVQVVTPSMTYDFAHPMTGSFHARQFRFKCEMAAEYISTVIRGKLHRAKQRKMMEGRWGGFAVLPGYMVDNRKILPEGSENPNWQRYAPFPAYAEVVQEYFRLFVEYAGNVYATIMHIQAYGPYYPDPTSCLPPEGFKFVTKMHRYARGYCPARTGLVNLLTNALVLGHWTVNGVVVRWNNHPPIVDEDTFWKAFNYLSPLTLEGAENAHFRPFAQNARPVLESEQERPVERPLCAGMLVSEHNGAWHNVGAIWIKPRQEYCFVFTPRHPIEGALWNRSATYIDAAVVKLLHQKLTETFKPDVWEASLANAHQDYADDQRRIRTQIATLERVKQSLILSLENVTNVAMVRDAEVRYEEAEAEHQRLAAQLAATQNIAERIALLEKLKVAYSPTLEGWERMSRDEKRVILHSFIEKVEAIEADGSGLKLTVHWIGGGTDSETLPKQMKNGWRTWLDSEAEKLKALVEKGATQEELCKAFAMRTWRMISGKILKLFGTGKIQFARKPIHSDETYQMYLDRIGSKPPANRATSAEKWTAADVECLRALYEQQATRMLFLETFPHRNWYSIFKKLKSVYGERVVMPPQDKQIGFKDRIADVRQRTGVNEASAVDSQTMHFDTTSQGGSSMAIPMPNYCR